MEVRTHVGLPCRVMSAIHVVLSLIAIVLAEDEPREPEARSLQVNIYDEYVKPVAESTYTSSFVHGNKVYILSTSKTTWIEAKFICQSMKGHLAILDSFDKALFVAEALSECDSGINSMWIGAQKKAGSSANQQEYQWIINQKILPRTSANVWKSKQHGDGKVDDKRFPAWVNRSGIEVGADCVALQRGHHDEPIFLDLFCHVKRGFVCEKEQEIAPPRPPRPQIDTVVCGGSIYKIFSFSATWEQALVLCNSYGMSLATFESARCVDRMGSKMMRMRPSIENAWIGGKGDDGNWCWLSNGEVIYPSTSKKFKWPPNRDHDGPLKKSGCLLIDRHVCNETVFLEARCDRNRSFICEKIEEETLPSRPEKPDNVHQDDVFFYILVPHPMPYYEATYYCEGMNGSLASIHDKDVLVHLLMAMGESIQDPVDHIWVSGILVDKNGIREWKDPNTGALLPGPEYNELPWCEDEDADSNDACLNLDRDSPLEGVVYGMPCDIPQAFVCIVEKSKHKPRPGYMLDLSKRRKGLTQTHLQNSNANGRIF